MSKADETECFTVLYGKLILYEADTARLVAT